MQAAQEQSQSLGVLRLNPGPYPIDEEAL